MTPSQLLATLERLRRRELELAPVRSQASAGLIERVHDPRELMCLALRYGVMGPPRSIGWVAQTFGVSKSRAAQIEREALASLRGARPARAPSPAAMRKRRAVARKRKPTELEQLRRRLDRMNKRHKQLGPAKTRSARLSRNRNRQALERKLRAITTPKGDK